MSHLTIAHLCQHLESLHQEPLRPQYAYVETGKYKPYTEATVMAARRRGYRVEFKMPGVYYVYPRVGPADSDIAARLKIAAKGGTFNKGAKL